MKSLYLLPLLMLMAGCGVMPMSNDSLIHEAKKCEAAGYKWQTLRSLDGRVIAVECVPPK